MQSPLRRWSRVVLAGLGLGPPILASCGGDGPTTPHGGFTASPHAPFPTLPNHGGRVLNPMRLVVIVPANNTFRDSLFLFADALTSSNWFTAVGQPYGVSSVHGAVKVTGPAMQGTDLTNAQLQAYIDSTIASAATPPPDGRSVYLLFLPSGVTFAGNNNCNTSGYHAGLLSGRGDGWGVVQQCKSVFRSLFEQLTIVGSHEIIEAATDPIGATWYLSMPAFPWTTTPWAFADGFGIQENADFCIATRYLEGGFYYQRVLTNPAVAAGGDPCVPALSIPYYNVTTSVEWNPARGGATIVVTGWSTAPADDWIVAAGVIESGPVVPTVSLTGPDTTVVNGTVLHTLNNGRTATLRVTFPDGGVSGDWAAIGLYSFRFDANLQRPAAGDDYRHVWVVGAAVPSSAGNVAANLAARAAAVYRLKK